ncbi:hypothetical protein HLB44_34880 [Aquincola sp. S2]|uniref:Uncharacterized protein n=1 Tax=Pseudaquabacterium terrae TaxID=2732868 RepID=A0ABX2ETV4_9BURK|nr:hypothetical protein [Aquabacterium terrae]NRF72182.1 hypothetical protein [Aquabacterium terrae]
MNRISQTPAPHGHARNPTDDEFAQLPLVLTIANHVAARHQGLFDLPPPFNGGGRAPRGQAPLYTPQTPAQAQAVTQALNARVQGAVAGWNRREMTPSEIRTAQRHMRQHPGGANLLALDRIAQDLGAHPANRYVDAQGKSTALAKGIKRPEKITDAALVSTAAAATVLTAGLAVPLLGEAIRRARQHRTGTNDLAGAIQQSAADEQELQRQLLTGDIGQLPLYEPPPPGYDTVQQQQAQPEDGLQLDLGTFGYLAPQIEERS